MRRKLCRGKRKILSGNCERTSRIRRLQGARGQHGTSRHGRRPPFVLHASPFVRISVAHRTNGHPFRIVLS